MKQAIEYSIAAIILSVLIIAAVVAGQNYITAEYKEVAFNILKTGVLLGCSGLLVIGMCRFMVKQGLVQE